MREEEIVTKPLNIREIALEILMEITEEEAYSHVVMRQVLEKYQYLEKRDRAFITRCVEGTLEHMIQMDYIIEQFSNVPVYNMKPLIRNLLRMSVYQMKYMDSVPDSAVCNEAVRLAQRRGFYNLKGFVNGVLRNTARRLGQVCYPDPKLEPLHYLSVKYSFPIEEQGIRTEPHPYLDYALKISGYNYIKAISAFKKGWIQVQDISSMLVAEVAAPNWGDTCFDVCAAPGGKSLHIAEKLMGSGCVEARDVSEYKVKLMQENIDRIGAINIQAVLKDATLRDEASVQRADIVLADVPCSGLGVIGKKQDIKYKMSEKQQQDIIRLQRRILSAVQEYVKPGGVLIYSTCTIGADENQYNIKWFLDNFPFHLESIDPYICDELKGRTTGGGYIQLLPGLHQSDGFFIARLRREDESRNTFEEG